jgi:hypothetical protein
MRLGRGDRRQLTSRRDDERRMRKPGDPVERSSLAGGADSFVMRVVRRRSTRIDVGRVAEPRAPFAKRGNAQSELRHQCQQGGSSQENRADTGGT